MLNYLTLNKLMHIWGIIFQPVIATLLLTYVTFTYNVFLLLLFSNVYLHILSHSMSQLILVFV